jgi:predicted enzyme related to lactoylglutathione lyase
MKWNCEPLAVWLRFWPVENHSLGGNAVIKAIKFVSVPVADQKRALEFYTQKLGFTIVTDQEFDAKQRWIELGIPGAATGVVLFTPDEHRDRIGTFSAISFNCDNCERTYEELKGRGVEFDGAPQKMPWGTFAKFRDSEGNLFVMSS